MDIKELLDALKKDYSSRLTKGMESPDAFEIGNRHPWQTRIASEILLQMAQDRKAEVRLFSGRIPEGFYGKTIAELLENCVRVGCRVRAVVWNDEPDAVCPRIKQLSHTSEGRFAIRLSGTKEGGEKLPHFLIVGQDHFRQEVPHKDFKDVEFTEFEPEVPARIVFHDEQRGKALTQAFDKLWEACA